MYQLVLCDYLFRVQEMYFANLQEADIAVRIRGYLIDTHSRSGGVKHTKRVKAKKPIGIRN